MLKLAQYETQPIIDDISRLREGDIIQVIQLQQQQPVSTVPDLQPKIVMNRRGVELDDQTINIYKHFFK